MKVFTQSELFFNNLPQELEYDHKKEYYKLTVQSVGG